MYIENHNIIKNNSIKYVKRFYNAIKYTHYCSQISYNCYTHYKGVITAYRNAFVIE